MENKGANVISSFLILSRILILIIIRYKLVRLFTAVRAMYSVENDVLVTLSDNEATLFEKNIETSSMNNDSFSNTDRNLSDSNSFSEIQITEYRIDDEKDIHTIQLANRLKEGIYFLEIDYQVSINENAFFVTNCCTSEEER